MGQIFFLKKSVQLVTDLQHMQLTMGACRIASCKFCKVQCDVLSNFENSKIVPDLESNWSILFQNRLVFLINVLELSNCFKQKLIFFIIWISLDKYDFARHFHTWSTQGRTAVRNSEQHAGRRKREGQLDPSIDPGQFSTAKQIHPVGLGLHGNGKSHACARATYTLVSLSLIRALINPQIDSIYHIRSTCLVLMHSRMRIDGSVQF